ncbi:Hsp33 family molecular chaperone HslO [Leptothermofonsia sichuanensis E412]|uniref:Hsp33 family molecular chaperone HslO n=1 Tax=Leptothermofonsia sichuanensis TaxID=2917832 RepID=UPI001CA7B22F|nr:Hsp33 family molecular chaperone HslO [Leptothermofonsia sichuanensis]QZZ20451.1 Hsp33 family molecular chaperone HslO [Leptothermofonsia sichuanensis E412]
MTDQLVRATAARGGIRAVGAITTQLTEEAKQRHRLSYVATAALSRTMTAGLLLASGMKRRGSKVTIRIQGDGPLGRVVADAGLDGTVRGFVDYPEAELPPTESGKFDVGTAVGRLGYVYVLRDEGLDYPYTSTVELVSGEVGEDVANYLAYSEQTPSALVLGESFDTQGVRASGGLLIQVLPKAANDEALVAELESRVTSLAGFTPLLKEGKTLPEIFEQILGGLDLQIFPETQPLRFHCGCSYDRALGALKLFSVAELQDMITEDQGAEAVCDFCGNVYRADAHQLEKLIGDMQGKPI